MTHLFNRLICLVKGHSKTQVPAAFYRSWYGMNEIGSLHCARCGAMLGDYRRNVTEKIDL